MVYQEIEIPEYRWIVYAFYDTSFYDVDTVMEALHDLNCDYKTSKQAYDNLSEGKKNTGLCYSSYRNKASVLVISETTSGAEFMSSFLHELCHLQAHISDYYHLEPMGEDAAYMIGEVARIMHPKVSHFLCNCCRKEIDYEKEK